MKSNPRILFFADAGPAVGGGHVMRCLTLARALTERGAECAFVESRTAAQILRRFGWPTQTPLAMVAADDLAGQVDWGRTFAERFEADAVVIDHYGATTAEETALADGRRRVVVIDDLAGRAHACDLLVDSGYGRRREHYAGLVGEPCVTMTGPGCALVRSEFAQARPRALSRRARHGPVRRALVSFGLTDVGGVTGKAVAILAERLGEVRLDVVLGRDAQSLEAVSALAGRDRRVRLHLDATDMATLVADADIAIGAGGSSVWERACLGLPSAVAILAENQREAVERLAEAGALLALDLDDGGAGLAEAWERLTGDRELRWALSTRSSELCDGRGSEHVAEALLDLLRRG